MTDYAIIANGPFLIEAALFEAAIRGKTIIALDGAANQLRLLGITPHVILGDFDSIDAQSESYWGITQEQSESYQGRDSVLIVPQKNQDLTDLQKAIAYCDRFSAQSISIFSALGGPREDHHEGTKIALKEAYKSNRPIIAHGQQQSLCYIRDESIIIHGQPHDYCGFVADAGGRCSSQGLAYECEDCSFSICNHLVSTSAIITANGGALVIMPTMLEDSTDEFVYCA